MAGWTCALCQKAKTFRRKKICAACDPTAGRGVHNKKILPKRRLLKKTDPKTILNGKPVASPADSARSPQAEELTRMLELEFATLLMVCDHAVAHGILAQAHHVVKNIDEAKGMSLPVATPVMVQGLLFFSMATCSHYIPDEADFMKKMNATKNLCKAAVTRTVCYWTNTVATCPNSCLFK